MKVAKLLPAAMADDTAAIRSLLVVEARRAGHIVSADANVITRTLVDQDWVPEEWRHGPMLLAEVECYPDVDAQWSCGRCGDRFRTQEESQHHADACTNPTMRVGQATGSGS